MNNLTMQLATSLDSKLTWQTHAQQQLGLTIHWHDVSFDDIITEVQNGQLDMGVSGFSITADQT